MTALAVHLLVRRPATARRADPLVVALLVAAVCGLMVLVAVVSSPPRPAATPRSAVVVDAGGHPEAALSRARAAARAGETVRVPRTTAEAAVDLRYFGAAGYARVVVVGPVARAAAVSVAVEYPRTRFVVR
jgi:hypothetical protein